MTVSRLGPMYDPLRNRGVAMLPFIYLGFVKDNSDVQRMGRLSVWIPELGGKADDPGSWVIASYMSPFAGATDINSIPNYKGNTQIGQQSYGLWLVPPDLNNEVCVFFAAGDVSRAYWMGCTYQQNMNHMVPGVAVNVTTEPQPPVHVSPVTEYNKANVPGNVDSPARPPFHPLTDGLNTEGLTTDEERGSPSTSARREAPSQVFGLLTPRGNTIHIDEQHSGDNATGASENEFIRLRTRSGTQVMIDETTGFVYINSKLGNAWLEVSDAGVDIYSSNSVSIRAQQDFNIRADRNIILDAGANIYLNAAQKVCVAASQDMNLGAGHNLAVTVGASGSLHVTNDLNVKADGNLHFESGTDTTLKAGGKQTRDGTGIFDNSGDSPSVSASDAQVPQSKPINDTTQTFSNGGSGSTVWKSGGGSVKTIVSRMPTHEPWSGHPNSKVPPPPLSTAIPQTGGNLGTSNNNALNSDGCSFGVGGTKPITTDVFNAIQNASTQTGAPMATMLAISDQESGFNPGIQNSKSSATGLFQFIDSTYGSMVNQYGNKYNVAPGSQTDANSNALMGGQMIQDNTKILQANGIANPTPGQIYMLNFLGNSGGPKFIAAAQNTPDAPAASLFPAAAASNKPIFYNSDGSSRTMSQVYTSMTGNIDAKATAYANQYGLPAPCQRGNGVAGNSPSSPAASPDTNPSAYANDAGKVYGNGQCVALVKSVAGLGQTATWQQGDNVLQLAQGGSPPPIGTAVATFGANGTYTNSLDGTSHAAIITGYTQDASGNYTGMTVLDQYVGTNGVPVPSRIHTIPFNSSSSQVIGNASNYNVINVSRRTS